MVELGSLIMIRNLLKNEKMTPEQLKAYHARMAELKSKIDFSTQQSSRDNDYQKKSFIDADGDEEELYN